MTMYHKVVKRSMDTISKDYSIVQEALQKLAYGTIRIGYSSPTFFGQTFRVRTSDKVTHHLVAVGPPRHQLDPHTTSNGPDPTNICDQIKYSTSRPLVLLRVTQSKALQTTIHHPHSAFSFVCVAMAGGRRRPAKTQNNKSNSNNSSSNNKGRRRGSEPLSVRAGLFVEGGLLSDWQNQTPSRGLSLSLN